MKCLFTHRNVQNIKKKQIERFNKIIRELDYKPGTYSRTVPILTPEDQLKFQWTIHGDVKDVDSGLPGEATHVARLTFEQIEKHSDLELIEFIHGHILDWEAHEENEWFKFNGKKVFDPHKYDYLNDVEQIEKHNIKDICEAAHKVIIS